jgi:hypothetical protein
VVLIEAEAKATAGYPGIGHDFFHDLQTLRGKACIGMQKKEDISLSCVGSFVHLPPSSLWRNPLAHSGEKADNIEGPVNTSTVGDNDFKISAMIQEHRKTATNRVHLI